jgi:hypothetical protein
MKATRIVAPIPFIPKHESIAVVEDIIDSELIKFGG